MTAQRTAVFEAISCRQQKHQSAEEIYGSVKKHCPGIGFATVYRTLQLFERLGLIRHILLDDGRMRFQIVDSGNAHRHHHLICEVCGEVVDVEEDMLGALEEKLLTENGFTVKDHKLQFFGICKKCAKKQQP